MTTKTTPEEITALANGLSTLLQEGANYEIEESGRTYWGGTEAQLRLLAEARTPKTYTPKVFVRKAGVTTVFIEKSNGRNVAVYIDDGYDGGFYVNDDLGVSFGDQVYGPVE